MAPSESQSSRVNGSQMFQALWRAYKTFYSRAEASYIHLGLCESDFKVLHVLLDRGPQPVNALGVEVELTTGSITTAIDRLEAKWLVIRKNHAEDRRVRFVELTSKGRRLIEKGQVRHAADLDAALEVLTATERASLMKLLGRLSAARDNEAN